MPNSFAFLHRFEDKVAHRAIAVPERPAEQGETDFATLVADVARSQAATEAARVETAAPAGGSSSPGTAVVDTLVAVLAPVAGEPAPSGSFNRAAAHRVPAQRSTPAAARPVHGMAPIRTLVTTSRERS